MIAQFVQNVWIESYDPTIEDSYTKQIEVDVRLHDRYGSRADSGRVGNVYSRCRLVFARVNKRLTSGSLDTAGTEQFSE